MKAARVLLVLLGTGCTSLGSSPGPELPSPVSAPSPANVGAESAALAGGAGGEPRPKPYAQVVPKTAVSDSGLFITHRIGSKLLFEIPPHELGADMLLVTQIAKTTLGVGYGGEQIGDRVVRWERNGNRVLLREVNYDIVADTALPIARAVAAANYHPVLAVFDIKAFGPDSAAVIDATELYTAGKTEFGVGTRIRGRFDKERSFLEHVASFPRNVEIEATHTYDPAPAPPMPQDLPFEISFPPGKSASLLMHWSMVRLPDLAMTPRLHDARVGYFTTNRIEFGSPSHRAERVSYITRWRLECADGQSVPCEPARPITYYVDPATPAWLVPFIKSGIEEWQPAFEAAGFRNAIVARDAPTAAEDPDWSAEDARYSVIRWLPSTIENAQGPSVVDPRSGEILEADIRMYHNVMNLQRAWYFTQVAPLDPRARRFPLPDSLMGRLVEYVVAHEVGHTLGFPHNMKASSTYAVDSVRNVDFLRRMSHTPTLMDYSRFNYVAQPEDNVPPELLIPRIGPYDKFATMWGYRPIPGATTPERERPQLDDWARMQDTAAYLRFTLSDARDTDPGALTEAVGDADAVRATELGLRNLRRVMGMLEGATEQRGEDYADLEELYGRTIDQWTREMAHVAAIIGAADAQEKYVGQPGPRFAPVDPARQRRAVAFLNQEAFRTPEYFLDTRILRKIEPEGSLDRIGRAQARVLAALLDNGRIARLIEYEALAERPSQVYSAGAFLGDVRQGVWSELRSGSPEINAFRRRLQRSFLDLLADKIDPKPEPVRSIPLPSGGRITLGGSRQVPDARALLRGELVELDAELRRAIPRTRDRTTRLHLQDARAEIEQILDPGERRGRD